MKTIIEYGKLFQDLRLARKYNNLLQIYHQEVEPNSTSNEIGYSFLLVSAISEAYCETGEWEKGIAFGLKYLDTLNRWTQKNIFLKNFGWYMFKALSTDPPKVNLNNLPLDKVGELITHLKSRLGTSGITEMLYLKWISLLHKLPLTCTDAAQKHFSLFAAEELSTLPITIKVKQDGETKNLELLSAREQWYMAFTKFLHTHQKWDECIEVCQLALDSELPFAGGGRTWITRRLALSLRQKGDLDHAALHMELLVQQKHDWYLQHELAEIYFEQGKTDKALEYAALALHNRGYSETKVNLLEFIGKIYDRQGDPQTALNFYFTAAKIREQKGWALSNELMNRVRGKQGIHPNPGVLYGVLQQILPVRGISDELIYSLGKITRILHEGNNGDGFITDKQSRSVYFRFAQAKIPLGDLKVGLLVKFKARKTLRNGQWKWIAIKVYPKDKMFKNF